MKKTYQLHSQLHNCDIQFTYTQQGSLCGFCMMDEQERTADQLAALLSPALRLEQLQTTCKKRKITLIEILPDLSFASFWKAYNYSAGSKKKAEAIWTKMPEDKRTKAMLYLANYDRHLRDKGTAKAYATSYLNGEYYEQ